MLQFLSISIPYICEGFSIFKKSKSHLRLLDLIYYFSLMHTI